MFSRLLAVVMIGFNCGFITSSSPSCDDMSKAMASIKGLLQASRSHKESIIEAEKQFCSSISSVEMLTSFRRNEKEDLEATKKGMTELIQESVLVESKLESLVLKFEKEMIESIASKYNLETLFDLHHESPEPSRTERLLEFNREMRRLDPKIQKALFDRYIKPFALNYDKKQYPTGSAVSQIMSKYLRRLQPSEA